MNWLLEQCFRNEGYWVLASILSTFLFVFDERSWHGLATNGYKFELQRFRTRTVLLAVVCVGLALTAAVVPNLTGRLFVTAASIGVFHRFQKLAYDFGGVSISGAGRRIILILSIILFAFSMLPFIKATFIPLIFATAGAASSLSSRNHLFFKLSQETAALRQRLRSDQARRHNQHLFNPAARYFHSSDDIASKAG